MKLNKGWIIGIILITMGIGFACQDQSLNQAKTDRTNTFEPQMMEGETPSSMLITQQNFRAHLNGRNEVPEVNTNGQGQAIFKLSNDGSSIHYKLIASNIDDILMAHIHVGPADENGPIVVWLYPSSPPPQKIEGRFQGVLAEGTITADDLMGPLEGHSLDDLLNAMNAGNTYVNLHTSQKPSGEIRGQIH